MRRLLLPLVLSLVFAVFPSVAHAGTATSTATSPCSIVTCQTPMFFEQTIVLTTQETGVLRLCGPTFGDLCLASIQGSRDPAGLGTAINILADPFHAGTTVTFGLCNNNAGAEPRKFCPSTTRVQITVQSPEPASVSVSTSCAVVLYDPNAPCTEF